MIDGAVVKHILFVITRSDEIGGAHIHVRDLALWLQSRGYRVSIVVGGSGFYFDHLRDHGLAVYPCSAMVRTISPLRDLWALVQLHRLIAGLAPDLISLHSAKAGLLVRVLSSVGLTPPCLFTAHGWSFSEGISTSTAFAYLAIERWAANACKRIITVCQSDFRLAIKSGVAQPPKLICIHNGMPDVPLVRCDAWNGERPIRLISIARFEPQKDHDTLISALTQLRSFDWTLTLVGEGSGRTALEQRVVALGLQNRVHFIGRSNRVADLLAQADLFLLVSKWEGFPRSILEAMRAGLPVIATNVGGVAESVQHGCTGWLIPPSNQQALTDVMLKSFQDPEMLRSFGQAGRDLFEQHFEFTTMALKTEQIYRDIWA